MTLGRRRLWTSALVISLAWLGIAILYGSARAQSPYIAVGTIDGVIDIISTRYLDRIVDEALETEAELLVVQLNTPGGLADSTRDMVGLILGSRVPVAVYVSPAGAQAASAGTFITAAAHFAAMAPATNIGAASPVTLGGDDAPDTLFRKVNEDTQAFIRSIAEERGRDAAALESTVTRARSFAAREAVDAGIVDLIASDLDDLLRQVDGVTVETTAGTKVMNVSGLEVRSLDPSGVERLLAVIANPGLAIILLFVGIGGIFIEISVPGFGVPGIIGALALALAFVALGQLPVNWLGVLLFLGALVLAVLEFQATGFGLFGGTAVAAFVFGAFLIFGDAFRTPEIDLPEIEFGVNPWLIGVLAGLFGSIILIVAWALRSDRRRAASSYVSPASRESLIGRQAEVTSALNPAGEVQLAGERWEAELSADGHADVGARVIVRDMDGLTLKVKSVPEPATEAPTPASRAPR